MSSTTVRVRSETRDAIARRARLHHQTADEVIAAGLAALEERDRRAQARADALRLAADEGDEAEVIAVQRDLGNARAW